MKNQLTNMNPIQVQRYLSRPQITIESLCQIIDDLSSDPCIREWVMNELERRDPQAFNSWLENDYDEEHPERYTARYHFIK